MRLLQSFGLLQFPQRFEVSDFAYLAERVEKADLLADPLGNERLFPYSARGAVDTANGAPAPVQKLLFLNRVQT
ncbi:MAG: hypothetical protein ACRERV_04915 [Methylococcales bacterium]